VKRYGTGSYQEAQEGIFVLWEDHQADVTARQLVHEIEMQRFREDCAHTVLKVHEGIKDSPLYSLEGRLYAQEALREAEAAIRALPIPEVSVPDDPYFKKYIAASMKVERLEAEIAALTAQQAQYIPNLIPVIAWLEKGCDVQWALKELRLYQQKLNAHQSARCDESAGATDQCKSLPEVVAAHIKDLRSSVPVLREYKFNTTAAEFLLAANELEAALQAESDSPVQIAVSEHSAAEKFCDSSCTWLDHHANCDLAAASLLSKEPNNG
jgi:hypothetical protein